MTDYAKDQYYLHFLQLFGKVVKTTAAKFIFWAEIARQRRLLQALSDEMLDDIGIDRRQARIEWEKPFWDIDVPQRGSSYRSGCSTSNHFSSPQAKYLSRGRA